MTPTQREAALRLADWLAASRVVNAEVLETISLLRELASEPQGKPVAWLDCWGEPHRTREMAMNSDESDPDPLYAESHAQVQDRGAGRVNPVEEPDYHR